MSERDIDQPIGEPDRRNEDTRMNRLETAIDKMGVEVSAIKVKVFNGMGTSIESTENKVDYIDKQNERQHKELSDSIKDLSKKFDKMLWFLVTSSIAIPSGLIMAFVKGWI